jgi:hypothetical protein
VRRYKFFQAITNTLKNKQKMKIYLLRVTAALMVVYSSSVFAESPVQDLFYDRVSGLSGNVSLVTEFNMKFIAEGQGFVFFGDQ